MERNVGGRRPVGKPRFRWRDAIWGYAVDLLPILNWKAARNGKRWKKTIGNTNPKKDRSAREERRTNKKTPLSPAINKVTGYKMLKFLCKMVYRKKKHVATRNPSLGIELYRR
jgi:hypothetical protein